MSSPTGQETSASVSERDAPSTLPVRLERNGMPDTHYATLDDALSDAADYARTHPDDVPPVAHFACEAFQLGEGLTHWFVCAVDG